MAKSQFVLSIGDDNVVLTRIVNKKVVNAWLASPDPQLAYEELGEAFAEDKRASVSVIFDTLDQAREEQEVPKVNVMDRRKVMARHINMAFPGINLRGARLIGEGESARTLKYEFASVPLDGRVPGWVDFVESLPNDTRGFFAIASENVDIVEALLPEETPEVEEGNHWRHLIGVNATGGFRQIIEKNGDLCLTRLTAAPPPETPPEEFADMIRRDFEATVTYIKRLGYVASDTLDLVILTAPENREAMSNLEWSVARSVTMKTPHEAAVELGLGSIGREDQPYCDVLHAAWFSSKRTPLLPLTRSVALGDAKDDLRDLAFLVAPYAAAASVVGCLGWIGWTLFQTSNINSENAQLQNELSGARASLAQEEANLATLPYSASNMRNVFDVLDSMKAGQIDLTPVLNGLFGSLDGDAVVLELLFSTEGTANTGGRNRSAARGAATYIVDVRMRLDDVITTADEAVQVAASLEERLIENFEDGFEVEMTVEPVAAQAEEGFSGGLFDDEGGGSSASGTAGRADEPFYTEFRIARVGQ